MSRYGQKFGIFLALAGVFLIIADAHAARKRVPGQYGYTSLPYWRVGALNRVLSQACQRGEFGQRKYLLYSIGYVVAREQRPTSCRRNVFWCCEVIETAGFRVFRRPNLAIWDSVLRPFVIPFP